MILYNSYPARIRFPLKITQNLPQGWGSACVCVAPAEHPGYQFQSIMCVAWLYTNMPAMTTHTSAWC